MSAGRAVLWDMDGTLIDSEEFHWIAWRDTMANEGITITHKQFLSSFGQRNDSILPRWLGASTPERIERIANAKEEQYRELIRTNGISPLPGVVHWVRQPHAAAGCKLSPRRLRARISKQSSRLFPRHARLSRHGFGRGCTPRKA